LVAAIHATLERLDALDHTGSRGACAPQGGHPNNEEPIMADQWQYQVRVYLSDEMSEMARRDDRAEAIKPVMHVLAKHRATMKCQFDAFADYVLEAEKNGTEAYPLYEWTKETIEDPEKKQKHLRAFAIQVDGEAVYDKDTADALEAELQPLVRDGLITRISKQDNNPANNIPLPARFRKKSS
jgi:hypothetical protein